MKEWSRDGSVSNKSQAYLTMKKCSIFMPTHYSISLAGLKMIMCIQYFCIMVTVSVFSWNNVGTVSKANLWIMRSVIVLFLVACCWWQVVLRMLLLVRIPGFVIDSYAQYRFCQQRFYIWTYVYIHFNYAFELMTFWSHIVWYYFFYVFKLKTDVVIDVLILLSVLCGS